jgi:putative phage-type endonuclease
MKKHTMTQRSEEWQFIRKGKVSGTQAKGMMGTSPARITAMYENLGESLKVGVDSDEYESPIARGNRLEPEAREAYELQTGRIVDEIGFAEHETENQLGNSPDGLVGDDGAIEIKCPEHTNYMRYWLNLEEIDGRIAYVGINKEIPKDYLWQVAQYFLVNEKLQWLDFIVYNPDITVYPMHVIHVTREDMQPSIDALLSKELTFIEDKQNILGNIIEF